MSENKANLREIPSVDALVNCQSLVSLKKKYGHELVVYCVRKVIGRVREDMLAGRLTQVEPRDLEQKVQTLIHAIAQPSLQSVINATGIILHTNLGRAPIGREIIQQLSETLQGYSNLEFDLATGERGSRHSHCRDLLCYLTGAEEAIVVNNNAAALIHIISTFARGKEVIISRGELVEIGGSFRVPEILTAGGATMVEVGTTNKTRIEDYEHAINKNTALIVKAHRSNFAIKGFTEEASIKKLAELGRKKNIPFVYDIGSGLLRRPQKIALPNEPDVQTALLDGADLVTFSGDKLLGGPQAGIICGRKDLVEVLAQAPMMRALRVGKIIIAALSSACRLYLDEKKLVEQNPLLHFLEREDAELKRIAEKLSVSLKEIGVKNEVVQSLGQCGGGTLPELELKSWAVKIKSTGSLRAEQIHQRLMQNSFPVIAVLRQGELLFDILTLREEDVEIIKEAMKWIYSS